MQDEKEREVVAKYSVNAEDGGGREGEREEEGGKVNLCTFHSA